MEILSINFCFFFSFKNHRKHARLFIAHQWGVHRSIHVCIHYTAYTETINVEFKIVGSPRVFWLCLHRRGCHCSFFLFYFPSHYCLLYSLGSLDWIVINIYPVTGSQQKKTRPKKNELFGAIHANKLLLVLDCLESTGIPYGWCHRIPKQKQKQ